MTGLFPPVVEERLPKLAAAKNIFTGKQELNGGFTNTYDTALWIAPATRNNPTNNSQGLYIQHRVSGDLGGLVHDAGASELRLNGATNTGTGQSAHEDSLVVTGGANTIGKMTASLANFHTEGTPSGTISEVALFRGTQIPALTGTITIDTVYGLFLQDQIVGSVANYALYSEGKVYFPYAVPKDSTGAALIARGRSDTVGGTDLFAVQNSTPTTLFRVTSSGVAGVGGTVSGCSFFLNNNNATGATVIEKIRAHSSQSANLTQWEESGGTPHLFVTAATSAKRANLVMGSAAVATSATDGFLYASSMAGAPSGTPTAFTGMVPVVIDTTNSKLMAYIGGAWKGVTLA